MKSKELTNMFYQPLGKLKCGVNSDTMWEHAKQRALEVRKLMKQEHKELIRSQKEWLILNTNLDVEKIIDFEEKFK